MKKNKNFKTNTISNTAMNLAKGIGWIGGEDLIINNGSGDDGASMSQLNQIQLGVNTNGGLPGSLASVTVVDLEIDASQLNKLALITKGQLMLLNAIEIIGLASETALAISNELIKMPKMIKATVLGSSADAGDLMKINDFILKNRIIN